MIGSTIVSGLIFAAICTGMEDFSSKLSYLQSSFETEKPYFTSCPKDEDLKKLFNEHKDAFHQIAKMAMEDKISSFRKSWIFHQNCDMVFFPYLVGEFPSDKVISREKFFKYLELMKECKIQEFENEYDDLKSDHPAKAENEAQTETESETSATCKKDLGSRGIKFFIFQEYEYDKVPKGKYLNVDKHIIYFQKDEKIKYEKDTDSLKELDIKQFQAKASYVRLEPNWTIRKSFSIQNESTDGDSNILVESRDKE